MSTYFVDLLDDEPWLFKKTDQRTCSAQPVASIADLLSRPAGVAVLSSEAFDELAAREPEGPNPAMVELLRQTRGQVVHADEKSTRIRELRAQLEEALAQRSQLRDGLIYVLQDLHPSYGSTAGPWGGIGGQMITPWCHVNDPYTAEHDDRMHELWTLLRESA